MKERTKDLMGRGAVAAALVLGVVLMGCGVPDSDDDTTDNPRLPESRTVAVQPAAVVTVTPETATVSPPEPAVTGPVDYETAETAWREGRFGDAVVLFTRYTEDTPGNPWGHYMLGLSARRTGDLAVAERAFETALAADPGHVKSLVNLARTLLEADRPEDALVKAQRTVELDPGSSDGYRLLGLGYADLGREFDAIEAYRQAIQLATDDSWSSNNLGLLHIRAGRYDQAIGPLAQAVTLRPDVAVFRNNLGVALEHAGAWGQAAEQYAVAAEGGHARARASRERILSLVGEGEPVIDLVDRARLFLDDLLGIMPGDTVAPPVDTVVSLPGESREISLLWDEVIRRHTRR